MVDNVADVVGFELVEYGYHHSAVGNDAHEGDSPAIGVSPHQRHPITTCDPECFELRMYPCYTAGNLSVGYRFTLPLGVGRAIPIIAD